LLAVDFSHHRDMLTNRKPQNIVRPRKAKAVTKGKSVNEWIAVYVCVNFENSWGCNDLHGRIMRDDGLFDEFEVLVFLGIQYSLCYKRDNEYAIRQVHEQSGLVLTFLIQKEVHRASSNDGGKGVGKQGLKRVHCR
jgi:hypothetical protein